jgi:hypothetical protein
VMGVGQISLVITNFCLILLVEGKTFETNIGLRIHHLVFIIALTNVT